MADERIKVCDRKTCVRKGKTVKRYKIETDEYAFQADLCREHSQPLRDFIAEFPSHFVVKVRSGGQASSGFRLHTMEEIEELKRRR